MREPMIAGNWKMHLGAVDDALDFIRSIRPGLNQIQGIERVLCPPFTVLAAAQDILRPTQIRLGAQNVHWEECGAHTGEISAPMLRGICQYVIVGHSERRATQSKYESHEVINRKIHAVLQNDLTPIICVGENLAQYETGDTHTVIRDQIQSAFNDVTPEQAVQSIVAYEPIWAIGTGKAATPAEANRVIGLTVRGSLAEWYDETTAQAVRVLYGGSVNPGNIQALITMPEIDGALVGGASLKPDFVDLVRKAAEAT